MSKLSKWLERRGKKKRPTPEPRPVLEETPYPELPHIIKNKPSKMPAWKLMLLSFRFVRSVRKGGDTVKTYSIFITLWKAFWRYLAGLGVVGATEVAAVGLPETMGDLKTRWPALLIALIPAIWRVIDNYRKNGNNETNPNDPIWMWPWE